MEIPCDPCQKRRSTTSHPRSTAVAALPQIAVDAFLVQANGLREPLGRVDFTAEFAERIARFPHELDRMLGRPRHGARSGIFVADIANSLPMEVRPAAWKGRVSLPGLREALEAVADEIHGDFRALHAACGAVRDAGWRLKEAEEELEQISAARWEPDASRYEWFYGRQFRDDFASDLASAADDWNLDGFTGTDPRPKEWTGPEYEAWAGRHRVWVRANMTPYAYGTVENAWKGITAERIREAAEEDEDGPDVEAMIEADMQDHHEDAQDKIEDWDGLQAAVDAWVQQGGLEGGDHLALAEALAAWNAKQTISSFTADTRVAVPAFPGVTHDEAMRFAAKRVEAARKALEAAKLSWQLPALAAEEAAQLGVGDFNRLLPERQAAARGLATAEFAGAGTLAASPTAVP